MGSLEVYDPVQEIAIAAKEVPPEFVTTQEVQQTLRHGPESQDCDDLLQTPVIDLQPLLATVEEGRATTNAEIGRACEDWGFFQVINHGIPRLLLEKTVEVVEGFFNLPLEEKIVYSMKPGQYQGYGRLTKPDARPWNDCFRHVVQPRPAPDQDAAPKTPAAYRKIMNEYAGEVVKLARRLTTALSEYFELEPSALQKGLTKELDDYPGMSFVLNFQPKCPEPDRVLALHAHTDSGALTVLNHNQVEGLQVLKDEKWVPVTPLKNALVVNIADQLEILTNGRLKSSQHRVLANSTTPRISIAAFCTPGSPDVVVGPLPQFVDEMHPPLFTPMEYSEYVLARLTEKLRVHGANSGTKDSQ